MGEYSQLNKLEEMKMLYHYYIDSHPTRFWHNDTCKIMILQDDNGMDVSEHQIVETAEGEYFEVDGKKINFMDFILRLSSSPLGKTLRYAISIMRSVIILRPVVSRSKNIRGLRRFSFIWLYVRELCAQLLLAD